MHDDDGVWVDNFQGQDGETNKTLAMCENWSKVERQNPTEFETQQSP